MRRHGRLDDAGVDGIRPNFVAGVLDGRGLGEDAYRALGGTVGRRHFAAHQSRHRRDVDDRAAAGLAHFRNDGFRAQENPLAVDVHDLVPKFLGGLLHRFGAVDAGVVDQDVQLAEPLHRGSHHVLPVGLAGHVQAQEQALAALLVDFRLHLPPFVLQHVGDDHPRALGGEQAGFHGSLAPGAAAD